MTESGPSSGDETKGEAAAPWLIAPPPPPPPGSDEATAVSPESPASSAPVPPAPPPPIAGSVPPPGAEVPTSVMPAGGPASSPPPPGAGAPPPLPPSPPSPPYDPSGTGPVAESPTGTSLPKLPFSAGSAAAMEMAKDLAKEAPWALAATAIVVAFGVDWFANIMSSLRHSPGLNGVDRIKLFFSPGSIEWALAIVLALALLDLGRKFDPVPAQPSKLRDLLPGVLFLAAAVVVVSAVIGLFAELTNFGNGIDLAFSAIVEYLAVLAIGVPAVWWAIKESGHTHG